MVCTAKLAIFDMDGTILYTLDDITLSTNHALGRFGFPERTVEQVRAAVGNGARMLIARSLPAGTSDEMIDDVFREFLLHYREHCNDSSRPYDGIADALRAIRARGIMTAVLSNKPDGQVRELVRQHFPGLFDFSMGERPDTGRKPSSAPVKYLLSQLGVPREQAVYIGDSDVDFQTAVNSHLPFIGVSWGFRESSLLQSLGAEHIARVPADILRFL